MSQPQELHNDFAGKYRPSTLDDLIGHKAAVQRLRGMLKTGLPTAFLLTGPSSVGKTTLARCLAAAINGVPVEQQRDYKEINGGDTRTIEDMRDLIKLSKFRPALKKRIFVVDESQQVVSNAPAAAALLKPLESGSPDTIWVLCSMDPSKFTTGNGKAIANRCQQFALTPPSSEDLTAYAKRIIVAEKMSYLKSGELVKELIGACQSEFRTLANLVQNCRDFYEGAKVKPERLSVEDLGEIIKGSSTQQDELVYQFVVAAMTGQFKQAQAALMDVEDAVSFLNQVSWAVGFLLNSMIVGRHKKVWWTPLNKRLDVALKKRTVGEIAALHDMVTTTRLEAASFIVPADELLTRAAFRHIRSMAK